MSSEPGKGSRFVVRLPLAPGHATASVPQASPEPAFSRAPRGLVPIMDDEPALARAMKRVLDREHEVAVATSGEEAREIIAHDPDLDAVISDLLLTFHPIKETGRHLERTL